MNNRPDWHLLSKAERDLWAAIIQAADLPYSIGAAIEIRPQIHITVAGKEIDFTKVAVELQKQKSNN